MQATWAQGWRKVKLFFILMFYSILIVMYSVHLIGTANKLKKNYNSVENLKKREVTMTNEKVQSRTTTSETIRLFCLAIH